MDAPSELRASFAQRWSLLLWLSALVLFVTVVQPYKNGPPIRSDGAGYHLWTYAILKGDLSFSWFQGDPHTFGLVQPHHKHHRFLCKYPPGLALVRLPLMACFADPDGDGLSYSEGEHWVCLIMGALALLAVIGLCLSSCERLGVSRTARHAALLLLLFGTGLFHYGTYDATFSHIYSALGAAALLWLAIVAVQDRQGRLAPLLTPLVVFLLLLFRNTNVVLIAFWSLGFFVWGLSQGVRSWSCWLPNGFVVLLGGLAGAAVQLALNYYAFRRWQLSSYGSESFDFSRFMMPEVLFSYNRGLFLYYPMFAVALLAGLFVRRTRLLSFGLLLLALSYGVLYGYWWSWELGAGFGHRGFIEMVPFLIPALALSLDRLGELGRRRVLIGGRCAVFATLVLMLGYWRSKLPMCDTNQHQYFNVLTFGVYNSAYKAIWGQRPPPGQIVSSPDAPAADASSGDATRSIVQGPTE